MRTFYNKRNEIDDSSEMVEHQKSPFSKGNWILRSDLVAIVNSLETHILKSELCKKLGIDHFDIDMD